MAGDYITETETELRNFVLRDEDGSEHGVFTGKQPRQAALKAANKGNGTKKKPVTIKLRERGTKKVHVFKGWKEIVKAVSYTHLRAHETPEHLVCRLLLEKKKKRKEQKAMSI